MLGWLKNKVSPSFHQPDADWIANASQTCPHTPDLWWLERRKHQLLFVYGTQMRGHPQHELVMNHGAYAAATYTEGKFTLWKKQLGKESFPIALQGSGWRVPDWKKPPHSRVQGELYAIETAQLIELDKHYQNTLEFDRQRVPLVLPYRNLHRIPGTELQRQIEESLGMEARDQVVTTETKTQLVNAWMYIGKPEYWDDQLSHFFSPVTTYTPRVAWLGDYASFTKEEYAK